MNRSEQITLTDNNEFDVTIIGGGVSGSRLYHELCSRGFRVLLIDKGDFGCGTSQASGMMIWGGLLYLKNLDFKTVRKLCRARDEMISTFPSMVDSCSYRYMPAVRGGRNRLFVYWVLMLYWMMGSGKRHLPRGEKEFAESGLIKRDKFKDSLIYEEAFLNLSDCRFVLQWLMPWQSERTQAVNYCSVFKSGFSEGHWNLQLRDELSGRELACRSKFVVNAAGVWTDEVNKEFGIDSNYKHIFSKGVYMNLKRPPEHENALIFEMGQNGDSQSYVPWGPVSMWGPTETVIRTLEGGFTADKDDVGFLLKMANRNLSEKVSARDIVSLRCGVRPLAVKRGFNKDVYPLDLSRKHLIHRDKQKNFLALYGGKLTSCGIMAEEVAGLMRNELSPGENRILQKEPCSFIFFPGLENRIPSPEWCRDYEACRTLEDFLRRRSNISQWIPNGGFGKEFENEKFLNETAAVFHGTDANEYLGNYKGKILKSVINEM